MGSCLKVKPKVPCLGDEIKPLVHLVDHCLIVLHLHLKKLIFLLIRQCRICVGVGNVL